MGRARVMGGHVASLAQIDTVATEDAGNYDSGFREPKRVEDGSWSGTPGRIDQDEIRVPTQIDTETFNRLDPMINGLETQHALRLTFAFKDLERAGLIDANRVAGIRVTAQLLGIYDRRGNLLYDMSGDRIFCEETRPVAFMGSSVNLLVCSFKCREAGVR